MKRFLLVASLIFVLCGGALTAINIKNKSSALEAVDPNIWHLSSFFKVDDDPTEYTEYTWNIPGNITGEQKKVFTFQINYSSEPLEKDYAPGDLQIRFETPFNTTNSYIILSEGNYYYESIIDDVGEKNNIRTLSASHAIKAKPKNDNSYSMDADWEYECFGSNDSASPGYCVFTNLKPFEAGRSVDGAIQVTYNVSSEYSGKIVFRPEYVNTYLNVEFAPIIGLI